MESPKRAPPHPRRALLFSTAFASVALLSGVVYGWPAMRRILRRNRVLAEGCTFDPATGEPFACNAQELRLGLVYTLGSYANNFSRFPIGIALDRVGPRVTVLGSCVTFALGAFVFAFTGNLAALSTGYVLIGTGGAGLQLALQSTAVLFPLRKSLMMSLLSGAFQVGSLLFLLMEVAEASFPDSASRLVLLCTHAAIGLAVGLVGTCIWPDKPFGTGGSKPSEEQVTHGAITPGHTAPETNTDLQPSPPPPPLHLASFWVQARSPEYQLVLIFFASNVLPAQFTVGTIGVQLERKGDVNGVHTRAYSIIFASAALAAPLAGMAIDRYGFPPVMAAINAALAISYAVLMVPLLSIQPIAYVAYSVGRVCLWALWFAYVAAEFGFKNYGKLAGGGLAIGAMFSLLQYAALEAVVRLGGGDFLAINGVWCALSCSMFAVIYELHRRERRCSQAAQV